VTLGIAFEVGKGTGGHGVVFKGYLRRLDGVTGHAQDMTPAFLEIHRQFLATERGLFASKGGKFKWAPLTQKYLSRKVARGLDPRVERATGALARALTTGKGPGAVTEISPSEAVFGTDLRQAIFAQRGSGRRRRKLVTIDRARRNKWTATIRAHLLQPPGGGP